MQNFLPQSENSALTTVMITFIIFLALLQFLDNSVYKSPPTFLIPLQRRNPRIKTLGLWIVHTQSKLLETM